MADTEEIDVPAEIAIKAAICSAFAEQGTTRVALAHKLQVNESEIRRVLDPKHRTKLKRLEEVARALGYRISIRLVPLSP